MTDIIIWVKNLAEVHYFFAIGILFLGIAIEGELFLLVLGIVGHYLKIPLPTLFAFACIGACAKTFLFYALGSSIRFFSNNGKVVSWLQNKMHLIFPHFSERLFNSIFFSKFMYGTNHAAMIYAGYLNADRRIYAKAEISASLIWLFIFVSLGYMLGVAAVSISHDIKIGLVVLTLVCVILPVCFRLLKNFLLKQTQ